MAPPVQGLVKLIVQVRCKVHQQMIRWKGNLGRISEPEKLSFQMVTERNYMLFDDLKCPESAFQRVGTATEKVRYNFRVTNKKNDK